MSKPLSILYCNCENSDVVSEDVKRSVQNALADAGVAFEAVPDLCALAARRAPELRRWARAGAVTIAACFPRAVRSLFHAGGAPLPAEGVEILNMRKQSAERIIASLLKNETPVGSRENVCPKKKDDWIPWFPVVDYERCNNCKQCLNFCLFGVYAMSPQGNVQVKNPAKCKTNCPACARVCPRTAIIFPKYGEPPINGDDVGEEDVAKNVNLAQLASEDILEAIRRRSKGRGRFATDNGQGQEPNGREIAANLEKLREQLDIPPEVLASLPSAGIMQDAGPRNDSCCPCDANCDCECECETACDCDCDCHDEDKGGECAQPET